MDNQAKKVAHLFKQVRALVDYGHKILDPDVDALYLDELKILVREAQRILNSGEEKIYPNGEPITIKIQGGENIQFLDVTSIEIKCDPAWRNENREWVLYLNGDTTIRFIGPEE